MITSTRDAGATAISPHASVARVGEGLVHDVELQPRCPSESPALERSPSRDASHAALDGDEAQAVRAAGADELAGAASTYAPPSAKRPRTRG